MAGAVWLWSRQSTAPATHDDGTPVKRPPPIVVEAVAPPRQDGDGEHPLARLARRSPQEAWRAAMALPESPRRERLRRLVATRWVERAPGEALDAFEALDEARMPTGWMYEMLARWMAVDDESASDWAYNTGGARPRVLMTGAIDWLLDHGEPREAALASAARMLRRWARRDPAAAWEVASADGLVAQGKVLLRGVAEVWLADDPRSAMDAAVAHGAWQVMRSSWVAELAGEWARATPREAGDWAHALPRSSRDDRLLAAIHAPLSVVAPDEAHALAAEYGEGEGWLAYARPLYEQQLRQLLGDDPRVLAEWLARQPDENLRASRAVHVAELFLKTDPDEALEWALGLAGKESANALKVVIRAIAEQDPVRAEDIVLGVSDPVAQAGAAQSFIGDWAKRRGNHAAYEWSVENLSTTVRQEVHPGLFWGWAMDDPAGAMSALGGVTDANIGVAAYALDGMIWGIGWGGTPERLRERMLALDRLYQDVVRLAPEYRDTMRFASPEGDLPSYKLYHYWKDIDPGRAARYRERAEGYDGPTK